MIHHPLLPARIILALIVIGALICAPWPRPAAAQAADPVQELLSRINAARVSQGLAPYALNDKLSAAAKLHSNDMALTGKVDRIGADGTTPRARMIAAGYGQWNSGPIVDETIYAGTGGAQGAFDWWRASDNDKGRLFSAKYREIGIGMATGRTGWAYWTIDLGAQPNVLPAFVNDGMTPINQLDVMITLGTENAVPAGEGMTTVGRPVQVRISSDDSFTGADWQPWAARVPFHLQASLNQRVYILYKDAQGRSVPHTLQVKLNSVPPAPTPNPRATVTPTALPSSTPTAQPTVTSAAPPAAAEPSPTVRPTRPARTTPTATARPQMGATSMGGPIVTPRSNFRPRGTPVPAAGPYAPPPTWLVTVLCALQAAALVLMGLAFALRGLRAPARQPANTGQATISPEA